MNPNEQELSFLSYVENVGRDLSMAQGFGGNCSFKRDKALLVKASGKRLWETNSDSYLFQVRLDGDSFVDDIPDQSGRPSIEVFLHALLDYKFVLHLHSSRSVAIGMTWASTMLPVFRKSGIHVALVEYFKPGEELRDKIRKHPEFQNANVFLLKNHGVVFGADLPDEMSELVETFENVCSKILEDSNMSPITADRLESPISTAEADLAYWHAQNNWAISPDHVLFLGAAPSTRTLDRLRQARTIKDLLVHPSSGKVSVEDEHLLWFFSVARLLPRRKLGNLGLGEVQEILDWDLEKQRKANA